MPTTAEQRLQRDVGANEASLPTAEATDLLAEAAETYSDAATASNYARVIAIRAIMGSAAKLTSYRQNSTSVDASDVFKHLKDLLGVWQGEVESAAKTAGGGAVRGGRQSRVPSRIRQYPGSP